MIWKWNKGFTLLEVLIALALMAVLATALYGSYFTVIRARERATEGMEARRELGATLELLRREISSAVFSANDKERLRFVVEDRDHFGKPASNLELTTLSPSMGLARKESGVIAVKYRMLETEEKKVILTRSEQDILISSDSVPLYPQMEHITLFLVECYDGSKWIKSWNTALNGRLPARVRITVQFEESGRPVEFKVYAYPKIVAL